MNAPEKIRFRCPGCDSPVAAPVSKAGARMRCPKCRDAVTVPAAPPSPAAAVEAVEAVEKVSHPGPGMLLRGDWLLVRCPACDVWCKVHRRHFNRDVACGACKALFVLELDG